MAWSVPWLKDSRNIAGNADVARLNFLYRARNKIAIEPTNNLKVFSDPNNGSEEWTVYINIQIMLLRERKAALFILF